MNFNCSRLLDEAFKNLWMKMFKHLDGLRVERVEWVLCLASHGGRDSLPCTRAANGHEVINFYNDMPASHSFLVEASSDFPFENSCSLHVVGPLCEPAVALCFIHSLYRGLLTDSCWCDLNFQVYASNWGLQRSRSVYKMKASLLLYNH